MASLIIVRLGELTLKGHNRSRFEAAIVSDVKNKLRDYRELRMESSFGRLIIHLNGAPFEPVAARLDTVFGIHSYSPGEQCALDLDTILYTAMNVLEQASRAPRTFKAVVRRANKRFPIDSMRLAAMIGKYVLDRRSDLVVDVRGPDVEIKVEIKDTAAYLSCDMYAGLGGYPLGTSGRALLLLSGGIDSPVAGYLGMKRGLEIEAVHYHSYPYTSERAQQKVKELAEQLSHYSGKMILHMVSITDIQTRIKQELKNDKMLIILIRRVMMRIAEQLASVRGVKAIVTGESLGQVASQTLESMTVIGQAARQLPVLRPLIMMDKSEIVEIAHRIGTYPISIQPFEDCCTLFVPKSPTTKPNLRIVERIEEQATWLDQAIAEAVHSATRAYIDADNAKQAQSSFF